MHADRWHFLRHFLRDVRQAYTREEIDRYIEAWSQPGAARSACRSARCAERVTELRSGADPVQSARIDLGRGVTAGFGRVMTQRYAYPRAEFPHAERLWS